VHTVDCHSRRACFAAPAAYVNVHVHQPCAGISRVMTCQAAMALERSGASSARRKDWDTWNCNAPGSVDYVYGADQRLRWPQLVRT